MSNRTRQNNKGADRKVESNDSPEIPDRGVDIRRAQPPFGGPNERKSLREDFESMKYKQKDQKARNKTKEKEPDPLLALEVASYDKPWWLRAYSLPGTPRGLRVPAGQS